jgi:Protein of unknown function (DUF3137)
MIDFNLKLSLREQLFPVLEQLEKERQLIITRNYNIIGTLSGIVFSSIFIAIYMENPIILVVSIVLNIIIYFLLADKGADTWATKYKQDVIGAVVKNFFGQYGSYEPFSGHNQTEFIDTELFSTTPDRYYSEDLIKGKVDKTSISFSEVHAEYKTTTHKGGTSWHTLFRGILFTADFNKHFKGRTIAKQKGFWNFISFGNIELENPEFRNEFAVYADDGVEARYILSPALMEKMLILNRNWGGTLGFSFIGSQLTIAIPMDTNFFEISHWTKIDLDNKWLNDWQIIADLTNIVHDLDLNTRIWTKE